MNVQALNKTIKSGVYTMSKIKGVKKNIVAVVSYEEKSDDTKGVLCIMIKKKRGESDFDFIKVERFGEKLDPHTSVCISQFECIHLFGHLINIGELDGFEDVKKVIDGLNSTKVSIDTKKRLLKKIEEWSDAETTGCSTAGCLEDVLLLDYTDSNVINIVDLSNLITKYLKK